MPLQALAPSGSPPTCNYGNTLSPVWQYTNFLVGGESYATVFTAVPAACACPEGFRIATGHMFICVGAEDVPVSFPVTLDLMDTAYDVVSGCDLPGTAFCSSPTYNVDIATAGCYDVALPMNNATCPAAFFGMKYALSFNFPNPFASPLNPVSDDTPIGCTSFNYYGAWNDFVNDYGAPGELSIYADVACGDTTICSSPALAIPDDDLTGVQDSIAVAGPAPSHLDVNLVLKATHAWVGDLTFQLTHVATATTVTPFDRPGVPGSTFGCSNDDVDATIDDEGIDGNVETTCNAGPAISGDLVGGDPPSRSIFSVFEDQDLSGTWTLKAIDNAATNTGTLDQWCLVRTSALIFTDGFESGTSSAWSSTVPIP